MTTKLDPNKPVYFFDINSRSIKSGRVASQTQGGNHIVRVPADNQQGFDLYFEGRLSGFTNDLKVARKQATDFFKFEIDDKRTAIKYLYKELFKAKWGKI